jgi:Tfp pilus assembly protein PilV
MKTPVNRRKLRQGGTYVEVLVAGALFSIGLMALMNIWLYSFRQTISTDELSVAYNLGGQAMERAKMAGFYNLVEGSTTNYYDGNQNLTQQGASNAVYYVTTTVTSNPPGHPLNALLTVTINVGLVSSPGSTLYTSSEYMVRGGI